LGQGTLNSKKNPGTLKTKNEREKNPLHILGNNQHDQKQQATTMIGCFKLFRKLQGPITRATNCPIQRKAGKIYEKQKYFLTLIGALCSVQDIIRFPCIFYNSL